MASNPETVKNNGCFGCAGREAPGQPRLEAFTVGSFRSPLSENQGGAQTCPSSGYHIVNSLPYNSARMFMRHKSLNL